MVHSTRISVCDMLPQIRPALILSLAYSGSRFPRLGYTRSHCTRMEFSGPVAHQPLRFPPTITPSSPPLNSGLSIFPRATIFKKNFMPLSSIFQIIIIRFLTIIIRFSDHYHSIFRSFIIHFSKHYHPFFKSLSQYYQTNFMGFSDCFHEIFKYFFGRLSDRSQRLFRLVILN